METWGLEAILTNHTMGRPREYLIDTGVFFLGYSALKSIMPGLEPGLCAFSNGISIDKLEAVFQIIQSVDNAKVTDEIYHELVCKIAELGQQKLYERNRQKPRYFKAYLKHNYGVMVVTPQLSLDYQEPLQKMVNGRMHKFNPHLKPLSDGDFSLLFAAFDRLLREDKNQLDIITSDRAIEAGAAILMKMIPQLEFLNRSMIQRAIHLDMKIYCRCAGEPYHEVFSSANYCAAVYKPEKLPSP